jgi:lysophospholipase L1-like esterase
MAIRSAGPTGLCRTRLVALSAALVTLAGGCGGAAKAADPSLRHPHATATRTSTPTGTDPPPMRIMPLGDSITYGVGSPGGYRTDLWQFLSADKVDAQFVGSQSSGPGNLPDPANEGHSGWTIAQIAARVGTWLADYKPDVILLHIGTNDILKKVSAARAERQVAGLISRITTLSDAKLYVATIIPLKNRRENAIVRAYDTALAATVRLDVAAGRHVRLVDMYDAVSTTDLGPDGVHPTAGGYAKIAARWYAAMRGVTLTPLQAGSADLVNAERLPDGTAEDGYKAGYLDQADSYADFTITVPATGDYRVYVRADNGTGMAAVQDVSVNGAYTGQLTIPSAGWDAWTITAITLHFAAGQDKLRLAHSIGSAELNTLYVAGSVP